MCLYLFLFLSQGGKKLFGELLILKSLIWGGQFCQLLSLWYEIQEDQFCQVSLEVSLAVFPRA